MQQWLVTQACSRSAVSMQRSEIIERFSSKASSALVFS